MHRCGASSSGSRRCRSRSSPTGRGGGGRPPPLVFFAVTVVIAMWVAGNPEVQAAVGTPTEIEHLVEPRRRRLLQREPRGVVRAAGVGRTTAWVAAQCIAFAILLGMPIPWVLFQNAANLGRHRRADGHTPARATSCFGLLTPHGLLELTAVFLAGAVGHAAGVDGDLARQPAPRAGAGRAGQGGGRRRGRAWSSCCWCRG